MTESASGPVIVVGADGSDLSVQAVRWAADQAGRTHASLLVVTGYEIPWTITVAPTYTEADYGRDAQALLDHTVDEALGPEPNVRSGGTPIVERVCLAVRFESRLVDP